MGEVIFGVDFKPRQHADRHPQQTYTRNIATEELRALDLYQFAATGAPPDVIYESSLGYLTADNFPAWGLGNETSDYPPPNP